MLKLNVVRHLSQLLVPRKNRKSHLERQVAHLKKFVSYEPSGGAPPETAFDINRMDITWIIPDFKPGAGGHMTIFRIASYLEKFGHNVSFLIQNPSVHKTGDAARNTINAHFQPFSGTVELFSGETPTVSGDALIATDRYTCYAVNAMEQFRRKFYFVQDYEPLFYPAGTEALLTEATYSFDFDCLCAGEWLHNIMSEKYGRWSMHWPLAFDKAVYSPRPDDRVRPNNRIALYARWVTPRRAVELAFMALEILRKRGVEFEVDFFGWKLGPQQVGFPYRDHGILDGPELAELYRQSTFGVVFSATNHSLVNREMMACGLPVIDLDLDTVTSIFPVGTIALAKPNPEGIADVMERLLKRPEERAALSLAGKSHVSDLSWETSARMVEKAVQERVTLVVGERA
ncbi:glycosyltransferase family 4 protein [Agrobacterium tumefaciens]|uniref:glycosyltransferase family 4 protein n=1 Tax=Agrobacterium tumefaciens TaxID=358 RepID=UPI00122FCEF2